MSHESLAGRSYPKVYSVSRKKALQHFMVDAVAASGGTLLYRSSHTRAPFFFGVQAGADERIGILCYPFTANHRVIVNRPPDEHRLQVKYGDVPTARTASNPLGRDEAGVDVTIVLGVNVEDGYFVGLEPDRYDPLPMGVMVGWKQSDVDEVLRSGWHVWQRVNRSGTRRVREPAEFEVLIGFTPDRLLDYVGFERRASGLGLDSPLRYRAALTAASEPIRPGGSGDHALEREFELTSKQVLDIIAKRARLQTAMKGGVAEFHLEGVLERLPQTTVNQIDKDGQPDFEVMIHGRRVLIECKNVSPQLYADGTPRVELQKTRSQKLDPAGRLYKPSQFDVVAVCMYAATDDWTDFRFKATAAMPRHPKFPDRLAIHHRIDDTWTRSLSDLVRHPSP